MKKSLLALAVLGAFAGTASAQSTVTLYGNIQLGVVKTSGVSPRLDVGNGYNQIGFKGSEDLGGGMKAIFDLRHRFSPESGGNDGSNNLRPAFQGGSIVGLSGGFGTVTVGRWLTPMQAMIGNGDAVGNSSMQGSVDVLPNTYNTDPRTASGATLGADGAGIARTDFIGYYSPNFGGFTASVAYGLKNSAADGNTAITGTETTAKSLTGLALSYASGPVAAAFGYEKNRAEDKLTAVNGTYNFGVAKLFAGYSTVDIKATAGSKRKTTQFGVNVPFGAFTAMAGYASMKNEGTGAKSDKIGLGGTYALSKRTGVYTTYGQTKVKASGAKTKGADFGIRHAF